MRLQIIGRSLMVLAVLTLYACHKHEEPLPAATQGETPQAAVHKSLALLKAGDFNGFWATTLPPTDYARLRADWSARGSHTKLADKDQARFALAIQQLTAPNAEVTLYKQLKPKLEQLDRQYSDQLPVVIGVGQAIISTGITHNTALTQNQKEQVIDALRALLPWAQQVEWFDPDKAKQALDVAVTTARQLRVSNLDQLYAMDFDNAMKEYSTTYHGLKQLLNIYGLSIDKTFDSVKVTLLHIEQDIAQVKIEYTLGDKMLSTESTLVHINNHWYNQDLLSSLRVQHNQGWRATMLANRIAPTSASSASLPASNSSSNLVPTAKP